jgi:hypothetical protein
MDIEWINNLALRESLWTPLPALNLMHGPDHLSNCKYEEVTDANRECSNIQHHTLLLAVVKGRKWTILDVHINCLQFPCCVLITSLTFILMCSLFSGWIIPLETSGNSKAAMSEIKWSFRSQGLFHIGERKKDLEMPTWAHFTSFLSLAFVRSMWKAFTMASLLLSSVDFQSFVKTRYSPTQIKSGGEIHTSLQDFVAA